MKKGKGDIGEKEKSELPHTRKIYTNEEKQHAIERVITRIHEGLTIPEIAKIEDIPSQTIIDWMNKNTNDLSVVYISAREDRADRIAREIIELADNVDGRDNAQVQKARLQTDVRKWYLSHILPEKYGDLQRLEVTGKNGGAIGIQAVGAVAIADAQRLRSLIFGQSDPIEADADEIPQEG